MKIEKIVYKNGFVNLIISKKKFLVSPEFYSNLNVNPDNILSKDDFDKIKKEDEFNRAKESALNSIEFSAKTESEIKNKLKRKNFTEETIEKILKFLSDYNLTNDEIYVKNYINDKIKFQRYSKRKIFYNLSAKGLDKKLISRFLDDVPYSIEYENAMYLAEKKAKNDYSYENKKKVYNYLSYRGFSYDIINECLDELF
ncbi:MAG: regulatory protein RecX [Peptoniphilaceae bacterium]|nr:recombination regulator RecX [Peptoniphilaceae bacterium]MDY3737714.1 regulatory protein RecX [Peptoniphilaceae bacterium]